MTSNERIYHGAPDVTPERADAWQRWKDDYFQSLVSQWIEQGATREQVMEAGAVVVTEFDLVDDMPWMPLGHALTHQAGAALGVSERPMTDADKRLDYISSLRTATTATKRERVAAIAYQLGVSTQAAADLVRQAEKHAHEAEEPSTGETALYRHYDAAGTLLYVGITRDPSMRSEQHQRSSRWFRFVDRTEVEWHRSRRAADDAERDAIATESPVFNETHNKVNRNAALDYLFAAVEVMA